MPGILPSRAGSQCQPISRVLSRGRGAGRVVLAPARHAWATIYLRATSPRRSSDLPEAQRVRAAPFPRWGIAPAWPCSRRRLPGRRHCCRRRWSLTPPFHPDPACAGRSFSVARALGLPRPGVTRHRALWSADFPQADIAACDRPADDRLHRIIPPERSAVNCTNSSTMLPRRHGSPI
jgi:hypothetical protein